ncbi:MAG: hypothetical protein C4321_08835 [Chloroflexota bacterium]
MMTAAMMLPAVTKEDVAGEPDGVEETGAVRATAGLSGRGPIGDEQTGDGDEGEAEGDEDEAGGIDGEEAEAEEPEDDGDGPGDAGDTEARRVELDEEGEEAEGEEQ